MARDHEQGPPPRCPKCGADTFHIMRIFDPATGRNHDLFECSACKANAWREVCDDKP